MSSRRLRRSRKLKNRHFRHSSPHKGAHVLRNRRNLQANTVPQRLGVLVVNSDGVPIRTTMAEEITMQYAALVTELSAKARSSVRDLDAEDDLTFLRIRSKKHEIMIAPDKEYHLIVVQDPTASE